MREVLSIAIILLFAITANGQTSKNAGQNVRIKLIDAIAINVADPDAPVNFNNASDYSNGAESPVRLIHISSNKNWQLEMRADANFLDNATLVTMPITGGLFKMKVAVDPDITIANGFDNYAQVTDNNQVIISTGLKGDTRPVTVQYKLTPGFQYPGGTYNNTVTFTATQL